MNRRMLAVVMRTMGIVFASFGLFAVLLQAPPTLGIDHDATPAASPGAMDGHGETGMGGTGAAYMVIRNAGAEGDRLVAGETNVAEVVEFHEVAEEEGVMAMRPLAEGVEVPAGGEVALEPGGYHVMLVGLTEDLTNGLTFDLTLEFQTAGEVTVPVSVRPRAEPAGDATLAAPVVAGAIAVEDAWSRPAPALGASGTPEAMPSS